MYKIFTQKGKTNIYIYMDSWFIYLFLIIYFRTLVLKTMAAVLIINSSELEMSE